jgi:hypothetical protein
VRTHDLSRCSDEELLERGRVDAGAFGVFYDRHEDALPGLLRRATGRADLAADLAGPWRGRVGIGPTGDLGVIFEASWLRKPAIAKPRFDLTSTRE